MDTPDDRSRLATAMAWSVHLLTASGVVLCLLALEATLASQWRTALVWLLIAVIIDAVDGTLARLVGVKQLTPDFDGALLDNLVDFGNYVIVPALIIHRANLLPVKFSFVIACAICLVSTYQFCQRDAKTPDHFFKGFPSYWNVVALYLLSMGMAPLSNLILVAALVLMVFIPIKYVYPNRTVVYRKVTLPLTGIWAVAAVGILWQLPHPNPLLVWSSLLYVGYYFCLSVFLTIQPRHQFP